MIMEQFEELSRPFLKTNVYSDFGRFFVSTIHRRSSASLRPDAWYYETFGWSLNEKEQTDHIIADNSGATYPKKAVEQHAEVCRQLLEKGMFQNQEDL